MSEITITQGKETDDYLYKISKTDKSGTTTRTVESLVMQDVLEKGIGAVKAQDAALAQLYGQMEDQTRTLNDINDVMQQLNSLKSNLQDGVTGNNLPVMMLPAEQEKIQALVDLYNSKMPEDKQITLSLPITANQLGTHYNTIAKAFEGKTLTAEEKVVYDAGVFCTGNCINAAQTSQLSPAAQEALAELGKKGLQLGGTKASDKLDVSKIETLQANLTTMQSSQGALNEDMSLKLNQAASQRAAIFTQLQTLLQTLMQTLQQLSRM